MKFKRSPFEIQEKNQRDNDIDIEMNHPTLADLIREQSVSEDSTNSVHKRRDLDAFGYL